MEKQIKKLILTAFSILLLGAAFISCGKSDDAAKTDNPGQNESTEMTEVKEENAYQESENDLVNVDYSIFYDELAPHGEWVQVNVDEIKNELSAGGVSPGPRKETSSLFDMLTGTQAAYADEDAGADVNVAFVWRPAAAVNDVSWMPFSRGEWLYTSENGWYFHDPAVEPVNLTYHYGRWWNSPSMGWVWMPGKAWSPAWVTWRESDVALAWAPVPPTVYVVNNVVEVNDDVLDDDVYVVVDKRDFVRPQIYKYMYKENKNKIMIKEMRKLNGPMVVNHTIINKGPEVSVIESAAGQKVIVHNITKVNNRNNVKISDGNIPVFMPMLKQSITDNGTIVSKPQKFVVSSEVKRKLSNDGDYRKGHDNTREDTKIRLGKDNNNGNNNNRNFDNDNRRGRGNDDKKFDDRNRRGRDDNKNFDNGKSNRKQKGKGNGNNDVIKNNRRSDDNGSHKNRGGRDNNRDDRGGNKNRGGDDNGKGKNKGRK
jgi:hypothetical protein